MSETTKLEAVPSNPLWEKNPESLTEVNFIIGDNPMETFSHVDSVLALFNDIHLMENPDRPEKFTYEGHAGYWICIHTLRSAIKTQLATESQESGADATMGYYLILRCVRQALMYEHDNHNERERPLKEVTS